MWPLKALMMAASVVTGFQNGKCLFSRSNPCLLQSTEGSNIEYMLSVIEDSSTSSSSSWEPYLESGGFCNHLYKNRNEKKMLKLYSELALKRMELSGFKVGELDILMGRAGLGPTIYNATKTHMIMEEIQGSVLTQQALCQPNNESMLDAVSKTLAKLHCLPTKTVIICYGNAVTSFWISWISMVRQNCSNFMLNKYVFNNKSWISLNYPQSWVTEISNRAISS